MTDRPTEGTATAWGAPALACDEMAEICYHLDRALLVFNRAERLLTAPEIRTKSLLSTVRAEADRLTSAAAGSEARRRITQAF